MRGTILVSLCVMMSCFATAQTHMNVELVSSIEAHWETAAAVVVDSDFAYVASDAGLAIVDISNPDLISEVGFCNTDGSLHDAAVQGSYAYVCDWVYGLRVIDISNPTEPVEISALPLTGINIYRLVVSGDYVYVAHDAHGMEVIDVSDPYSPIEVAHYNSPSNSYDVAVHGDYAYVAVKFDGLRIIDVSNPSGDLQEVGFYNPPGIARGISVEGDYAYLAMSDGFDGGVRIIDITDATTPVEVGFCQTPNNAYDAVYDNGLLYAADEHEGLRVFDVSNPATPIELGYCDSPGQSWGVAYTNGHALLASHYSGLRMYDVSNPSAPVETSYIDSGRHEQLTVVDNLVYVALREVGLQIIDISDVNAPQVIGQLDTPDKALDVEISGNYAYVADKDGGIRIVDVSDPYSPSEVAFTNEAVSARGIDIAGNVLYVADGSSGFKIFDISTSTAPVLIGFHQTTQYALDVTVSGSIAYVVDSVNDLEILDVSDPANPVFQAWFYIPTGQCQEIKVRDDIAYMAYKQVDFRIADVSDPQNPVEIGHCDLENNTSRVDIIGNFAFLGQQDEGVRVIDISDPTAPYETGFYDTNELAYSVAAYGQYALLGAGINFYVFDCSEAMEDQPLVWVSLSPPVPNTASPGDFLYYGGRVVYNHTLPAYVDIWTEVTLPNGNNYGPLLDVRPYLTPSTIIDQPSLPLFIPNYAPSGNYVFQVFAGRQNPLYIVDTDSFPFEVLDNMTGSHLGNGDWHSIDHNRHFLGESNEPEAITLPDRFALSPASPNPFNAATTVAVTLPESADLEISVYNISGQRVAELAEGSYTAGRHRFTFDASGLASGLYFVRATVPGQMDQVRKVMLVR